MSQELTTKICPTCENIIDWGFSDQSSELQGLTNFCPDCDFDWPIIELSPDEDLPELDVTDVEEEFEILSNTNSNFDSEEENENSDSDLDTDSDDSFIRELRALVDNLDLLSDINKSDDESVDILFHLINLEDHSGDKP